MSGVKGRSGRHKSLTAEAKDIVNKALEDNDTRVPKYLKALAGIALDPKCPPRDRIDCLQYLINRSQGSPKAKTDLQIKAVQVTPDELAIAITETLEANRPLLLALKEQQGD